MNILLEERPIKPLHPTSTSSQRAHQPLCLHFNTKSWYFDNFFSRDSSIWSSHGTVNSHYYVLGRVWKDNNVWSECCQSNLFGKLQLFPYVHFELPVLGSWKPLRYYVCFWAKVFSWFNEFMFIGIINTSLYGFFYSICIRSKNLVLTPAYLSALYYNS